MAGNRKLGKTTDIRLAMLKTQVTDLILHGKSNQKKVYGHIIRELLKMMGLLFYLELNHFPQK